MQNPSNNDLLSNYMFISRITINFVLNNMRYYVLII